MVLPSYVAPMLTPDSQWHLYQISGQIVTILLVVRLYVKITWRETFNKLLCVLILIASLYYLLNYMVVIEDANDAKLNFVSE